MVVGCELRGEHGRERSRVSIKFPRDVQGFRAELDDLGNEGWTIVCLEGPWHAKPRNTVFRELLDHHAHCFPGGGVVAESIVTVEVRRWWSFLWMGIYVKSICRSSPGWCPLSWCSV